MKYPIGILLLTASFSTFANDKAWHSEKDYIGYGYEAYLDYLIDKSKYHPDDFKHGKLTKRDRSKRGGRARSSSEVEEETTIKVSSIGAFSKKMKYSAKGLPCDTVWQNSSHRWRYDDYRRYVYVWARIWVDSYAFVSTSNDPDACGRPRYTSGTLSVEGTLKTRAGRTFARVNNKSVNRKSSIKGYDSDSSYFTYVDGRPNCGYSKHSLTDGRVRIVAERRSGC